MNARLRWTPCKHCGEPFSSVRAPGPPPTLCDECRPTRPAFLLWEGPSRFTDETIRVFVRHPRAPLRNPKLGDVCPVVIVPAATMPLQAVKTGADRAVCGDCRLRPSQDGGCYVRMFPGPECTAYAHRDNPLPRLQSAERLYRGQVVRIAEWGDPAAVPLHVWTSLRTVATVLAYTHAWRDLDIERWGWCMASVETTADKALAEAQGWRTYRVRAVGEAVLPGERQCPAALEAIGHGRVTCHSCRLCDGQSGRHRRSISLEAHGRSARRVHARCA